MGNPAEELTSRNEQVILLLFPEVNFYSATSGIKFVLSFRWRILGGEGREVEYDVQVSSYEK